MVLVPPWGTRSSNLQLKRFGGAKGKAKLMETMHGAEYMQIIQQKWLSLRKDLHE